MSQEHVDTQESAPTFKGRVKFWNAAKGFGFVTRHGGGKDVFVNKEAIRKTGLTELSEGDLVAYTLGSPNRSGDTVDTIQVVGGPPRGIKSLFDALGFDV